MGMIMSEIKGKADGNIVRKIVEEEISVWIKEEIIYFVWNLK